MRALIGIVAAGFVAVAIGVWLNAASRSTTDSTVGKATLVPSITPASNVMLPPTLSIWEIHNQAHLENLPVQEADDQSLVFSRKGRR
jgi:hypothetical protein